MDGEIFKAELKERSLSQAGFGRMTSTPIRSIENWAGGVRPVPIWVGVWFDQYDRIKALEATVEEKDRLIEALKGRIASLGGKV